MTEPRIRVVSVSGLLCLVAAALFLLAAFGVTLGAVSLGWLGLCFLAAALIVP